MKALVTSLIYLVSGTTAFTSTNPSTIKTSSLSSSRYNDDYYRDYSNYNSYNNNNNRNYDNYVIDRNAGRFDNSVGSASYGSSSYGYGGNGGRGWNTRRNGYGSSGEYRTYDSYNSNDYYRGGGSVIGDSYNYNRPYDRIGSSENFRLTSSPPNNSRRMRNNNYYYDDLYDYDNYNSNSNYYPNNYVQQRRGGYADDIGGRSRYSTPMYSNGGYASPQGLSEDFRTGREGPMSSMTSRQRQIRNNRNYSNRIQDYYTPGERELMSQRDNNGLRYGWQQQYNRGRGNVRMGSGEDFRRGSALTRISDYFTPLERERRQMSDNRALGRGGRRNEGYYDRDYYGSSSRGGGRGVDGRRGGYYEDYPDYGFGDYYDDDEYDDYFENDGGYSSGSRRRGRRNGNTWDNLLNMFRS